MSNQVVDIAANLRDIRERMAGAAGRVGRQPGEISLVAVSKTIPVESILAALEQGQIDFGENRVEQAWRKFVDPQVSDSLTNLIGPDQTFRLHLIGPIQSRKAALAVACQPTLVHAVDRVKIARRLDRVAQEAGALMNILLEVNVSGEMSKFGFAPERIEESAREINSLSGLRISGLMTMPPFDPDPEMARPHFAALRDLRDRLSQGLPEADWHHLSMGMSHDFEVAIEEGATIVRVGTAIFGSRL
ncbi:MAG: YggS family pyridoxal phosphate-dependent enzyme [Chloroflexota bacterium]|nr:YggS family pyridoxal phosphate-dependent enzyme [Chloroflexota bacterium]